MTGRRYPWVPLVLCWAALSTAMLVALWHRIVALEFRDPDDYMRLLQVRDLIAGQSWFDLTQHRIDAPGGLAMHWSRLVDLPILAFFVPLRPLLGTAIAERVAVAGAPLLTLLALMLVVAVLTRSLISKRWWIALLAGLFAIGGPLVFTQIQPARIDHHGWQIVFAVAAFAALLDRHARRAGLFAGAAAALYLTISIEGAPFVAALGGALGLCWIMRIEEAERLVGFVVALAVTSAAATALLAPSLRWTDGACDAVGPSHLVALALVVPATLGATWWGTRRSMLARTLGLGLVALLATSSLALLAPVCLGDPYGAMLPQVRHYWFENVIEGLPIWHQPAELATLALAFPLLGLAGSISAWRNAGSIEMQRRWFVAMLLSAATLATGALVLRSAGLAHVVAVPGTLVLLHRGVMLARRVSLMPLRVVSTAAVILGLSPTMPVVAAALVVQRDTQVEVDDAATMRGVTKTIDRLSRLAPTTIFAGIDVGPEIVARTRHRVHAAGYHRLQRALADTIDVFTGSDDHAHRFLRDRSIRLMVFAPASNETGVYVHGAPDGFAAHLKRGEVPHWLRRLDTGSPLLQLYVRRD